MTNDELLAGFLDRTLNEDQLLEFEARKESDPAFSSDVHDMLALEGLLKTTAPKPLAPAGFLVAVESAVALKMASSTGAGATVGGFLSSTWLWVASAGMAVIGAAAVYLSMDSSSPQTTAVKVQQPITEAPRTKLEPATSAPSNLASTPAPRPVAARPLVEVVERPSTTVTDGIPQTIGVNNEYESTLAKLKKDLDGCRLSGDHIRCTQIALQIGRTYRERQLVDGAMEYLSMALVEARESRIIQYEVDAYGEMGLVLSAAGNTSEANVYFEKAIELGERHGIDVMKWSRSIR